MFGESVKIPQPKKGEDARVFAARERAAILEGNQRLRNDRSFYQDVLDKFSGTK